MKTTDEKRAQMVDKIIRLSYDSLSTHLPYTHNNKQLLKIWRSGDLIRDETIEFHILCVKEYAQIIYLASKLY
jgi:hypothetical protein